MPAFHTPNCGRGVFASEILRVSKFTSSITSDPTHVFASAKGRSRNCNGWTLGKMALICNRTSHESFTVISMVLETPFFAKAQKELLKTRSCSETKLRGGTTFEVFAAHALLRHTFARQMSEPTRKQRGKNGMNSIQSIVDNGLCSYLQIGTWR